MPDIAPMGTPERAQRRRPHVFVVNGAPAFLDLMRELLQDERYNVTTTNFVPRTLEQVAALQPSLLVIDLEVGRRAGWDLLERLRGEAATNGIPVVVVATDPRLLAEAKARQARYGGQGWVAKPVRYRRLDPHDPRPDRPGLSRRYGAAASAGGSPWSRPSTSGPSRSMRSTMARTATPKAASRASR